MKYAMELIEAGTFLMGSPEDEAERSDNQTQHHVTLTKSFYMGKYAVTQKQYEKVMGNNPSYFQGESYLPAGGETQENRPVEQVSWYDALVFCNTLSIQEGYTPAYTVKGSTNPNDWGNVPTKNSDVAWDAVVCDWNASGYRLPTEAEWEYAAKGGPNGGADYAYAGGNNPDELAWYEENSGKTTHPVGKKKPNSLGLYDMSGNVWEWCWDLYDEYESGVQINPRGTVAGNTRVGRGGNCYLVVDFLPLVNRIDGYPSVGILEFGFRVVRSVM